MSERADPSGAEGSEATPRKSWLGSSALTNLLLLVLLAGLLVAAVWYGWREWRREVAIGLIRGTHDVVDVCHAMRPWTLVMKDAEVDCVVEMINRATSGLD